MHNRILTHELQTYVGQQVHLYGWLHIVRKMGGVNFLILRDRAGLAQAVMTEEELKPLHDRNAHVESIIHLCGTVVAAPPAPGGYELQNAQIEVLNATSEPTPIELNKPQIKAHLPFFLDHAVVGLRHPERRATLKMAAGVMAGFRAVLQQQGFTEIQSPKMVGSATEGGANVYALEHFGQKAYLAQSPQLYKQVMVGIFERVYEVGPVFRAEPHSTTRHINEYVSLDVEFGFIRDHFEVMAMAETVVRGILAALQTNYPADVKLLKIQFPLLPSGAFPWIHFHDAQVLLTEKFGVTDALGEPDLAPEHERILGRWAQETHQSDFLFVVGYPMKKRPFYTHPDPARPEFSNSFDLLFRGTELITGGQRLHLYQDYLNAAKRFGYATDPFNAYFEAFKHGMPPHGGFAIGLERFVMQLLQLDNIRWATLFPRDIHRLTP
jgi:nondiscriminating aspartyl-tRNA synthetase